MPVITTEVLGSPALGEKETIEGAGKFVPSSLLRKAEANGGPAPIAG